MKMMKPMEYHFQILNLVISHLNMQKKSITEINGKNY